MGGTIKKLGKNRNLNSFTVPKKRGRSHSVEKSGPFCFEMAFYLNVRGFGCVENEVLSTYGKCCFGGSSQANPEKLKDRVQTR